MQQPQDMDSRTKFIIRLVEFVSNKRTLLLGALGAITLLVIGYFVWSAWEQRVTENSTLMAEEAQTLFQDWRIAAEDEEKQRIEGDLQEKLSAIIRRYPREYAATRALFIRAQLAAAKENWDEAVKDFQDLARSFPRGYLAPISLFNAAVALEEQDKIDAAIAQYQELIERFPDSYIIPQAIFSMGRLHEAEENYQEAAAQYNRLVDEHSSSGWTIAARNRIIELQIQGRIPQ